MSTITKYLEELEPFGATLIAVSKTKPDEMIQKLYEEVGQRDFGENKVQELVGKYERLPKDIRWHMIGHLQRNKVKYIAPFVDLIHSVDSEKLLREINKEARKNNRKIKVLLQIHIAQETEKFGFSMEEVSALSKSLPTLGFENIEIVGLMGMATYTEDSKQIAQEFTQLHELKIRLNEPMENYHQNFKVLSMGMSGDYKIALANGSTMIRIGSAIFGARNYA
jgi:hypothetical protein